MRWLKKICEFICKTLVAARAYLIPGVRARLVRCIISLAADPGPLPGLYNAGEDGKTSMHEVLKKEFFALDLRKPTKLVGASSNDVSALFERGKCGHEDIADEARVSLLFAFFAQHLSDAVFQSGDDYTTKAPHEIVLNQIYGNCPKDEDLLRAKKDGKLITVNTKKGEFPPELFGKNSKIAGLSYLKEELTSSARKGYEEKARKECEGENLNFEDKLKFLKSKYPGTRQQYARAVGLFQGNLTLGNFALTSLFIREHNAICEGLVKNHGLGKCSLGKKATDEEIFQTAKRINILIYIKIIIEDYINTIIGLDVLRLPLNDFFYEKKRWCRETPMPYHFNILYRWHSMIPNQFNIDGATKNKGIKAFFANNELVMNQGLGAIFEAASAQPASILSLHNTHPCLLRVDSATLRQGQEVLQPFNAYKEFYGGSPVGFDDFEQAKLLKSIYNRNPDNIDFYVGIIGEKKERGLRHKLCIQKEPLFGPLLGDAVARHAFRHVFSNRLMSKEFLNEKVLTSFGWKRLKKTSGISDLVKRNVKNKNLVISFDAPNHRNCWWEKGGTEKLAIF